MLNITSNIKKQQQQKQNKNKKTVYNTLQEHVNEYVYVPMTLIFLLIIKSRYSNNTHARLPGYIVFRQILRFKK